MTDALYVVGLGALLIGITMLWGYPTACVVGGILLLLGAMYRQTVTDPAADRAAQARVAAGETL